MNKGKPGVKKKKTATKHAQGRLEQLMQHNQLLRGSFVNQVFFKLLLILVETHRH